MAGVARLQYTRTVALLIHDVLIELNMTDWRVMHAVGVHLKEFATSTLLHIFHNVSGDFKYMSNVTGLEKANDALEAIRDQQFNAVVLFGDLVSFGIIPHNVFVSVINGFLENMSSISHYRIIHLLVLRATCQTAALPIHPDCLLGWQDRLLRPMQIKLRLDDKMIQRWIVEIRDLIDKADLNAQHQATMQSSHTASSPAGKHIWDRQLTSHGLHNLIRMHFQSKRDMHTMMY